MCKLHVHYNNTSSHTKAVGIQVVENKNQKID